jgi:hypothetical protein
MKNSVDDLYSNIVVNHQWPIYVICTIGQSDRGRRIRHLERVYTMNFNWKALGVAVGVGLTAATVAAPARAEQSIIICQASLGMPVAAAACAGIGVLAHEIFLAERPFGPNGEVMKVLVAPVNLAIRNLDIAKNESGVGAQILAGTTGISMDAIEENGGVLGGGLSGGEGSFFRKNLGIRF